MANSKTNFPHRSAGLFLTDGGLETTWVFPEGFELPYGDPQELGNEYKKLKQAFSQLNVFGGCCGTDEKHILEIV